MTKETTQHKPIKGEPLRPKPEGELHYFRANLDEFLRGEKPSTVALAISIAVDLTQHGYGDEVMEALKAQFKDED